MRRIGASPPRAGVGVEVEHESLLARGYPAQQREVCHLNVDCLLTGATRFRARSSGKACIAMTLFP
jgi:hypothetical protein